MKTWGSLDGQNLARARYFAQSFFEWLVPGGIYRYRRPHWLERLRACDDPAVFDRAAYCNQVSEPFDLANDAQPFHLNLRGKQTAYQLDLYAGLRYFPTAYRVGYQFGDIRVVPGTPTLVKSRPIGGDNRKAILFNLNRARHFYFVRDPLRFTDKRGLLVWRGRACQPHRKVFLAHYHNHPLCDVGHYHRRHQDVVWTKPRLSVSEQLRYKYILSIEGNDVATSLKWTLSSRSLCFMTRPRFETWFMEGRLVPGRHYVLLKDDYSDLEEKISYYNTHPEEAEAIVDAANRWVAQFSDPVRERLIHLLVLWRYFHASGQWDIAPPAGRRIEGQDQVDLAPSRV